MPENFEIIVINSPISREKLFDIAQSGFGNMVKAVVDIEQKIISLNGELHADEEALMLDNGSEQKNLWGINLYPDKHNNEFVEFDSMINIRPSQNNRTRSVENQYIREKILEVVNLLIQ